MALIGQIVVLLLLCVGVLFFAYQLYHDDRRIDRSLIIKLLLGTVMGLIGVLSVLIQPPIWWLYIIGTLFKHYGVMLAYFSIDQLLNNRFSLPILKTKVFRYTTILSIVTTILNYLRRDNITIIIGEHPFTETWQTYAAEFLHHCTLIYLGALIVGLYWQDVRKHTELTYTLRRFTGMLAFLMMVAMSITAQLGMLLALRPGDSYRAQINSVYSIERALFFGLLVLSLVVPQWVYAKASAPLQRVQLLRQRRRQALLAYLHARMIQIVPGVCLQYDSPHPIRRLIEISDARDVIWSHTLRTWPLAPRDEAQHILLLLRGNTVLSAPGEHLPPPLRHPDVIAHNLAVARYLHRLERAEYRMALPSRRKRIAQALSVLLQKL